MTASIERRRFKTRARAPLRLGLAGGGTDLSPYCDDHGGAVLNVTIDRYAFASVLSATGNEVIFEADDLGASQIFDDSMAVPEHLVLHAAVYRRMMRDFNDGEYLPLIIRTTVDAPAGSGLGSSSALVVALVSVLGAMLNAPLGDYDIARLAFEIERIDLGLSGGKQDHYSAAFGGVNFIEFLDQGRVIVNPLRLNNAIYNEIESSIVACYCGRSRRSAEIIDRQTAGLVNANTRTIEAMHSLKNDAVRMKQALLGGDIDQMAKILHASWLTKQQTAPGISTGRIDELMDVALRNGALAGKVSGAGGGGFMFFLTPPEARHRLMHALEKAGGEATPVKFTATGCETWRSQ